MVDIIDGDRAGVTDPLYGYKTDIIEDLPERVPRWAYVPSARCDRGRGGLSKTDRRRYLQNAIDEITAMRAGDDEYYIETTAHGYGSHYPEEFDVPFAVSLSSGGFGNRNTPPRDIVERMKAIQDSSIFDRLFDGYHVKHRGWQFRVFIGRRGGIRDVDLIAWGK